MNSEIFEKYKIYIIAGAIAAVLIIVVGGFFFYKNQTQNQPADPNNPQAVQEEVRKIVAEVGKLMDLPVGEDPTVATVTDVTQLQNQPFFQKAKNGDKVLIYSGARKAILYDPQAKRIVDVSPININNATPSAQQATPSAFPN